MANMLFANNCNTTLNGGITAVATSMIVTSATGFPAPTGSQYFYCTLADAATQTTIEIVKVTAVSGTTFTIVRGQDGTTGTIFASGDVVSLRLVRASLNDFPKLDENNTFSYAPTFNTALGVASGGTGLTSLTAGYIPYGNGTSAFNFSSTFTYNGNSLTVGNFVPTSASIPSNGMFLPAVNTVGWATNSVQVMQISSTGGVSIGNTTDPGAGNLRFNSTSNGIYFGSSSKLNDYQEGTWTATLTATTTAPTTPVTVTGTYTKIGRLVTVTCSFLNVNTTGAIGNIIITGLPFTVGSYDYQGIVGENSLGGTVFICTAAAGTTTLQIRDAATTVYTPMIAGPNKYLLATITYTV